MSFERKLGAAVNYRMNSRFDHKNGGENASQKYVDKGVNSCDLSQNMWVGRGVRAAKPGGIRGKPAVRAGFTRKKDEDLFDSQRLSQ